ncbi:MAG: alkaline phosphatase family protein [Acetobacteraceae bacterium]|nr:alkaline phosphatase family protein [Acetobacteraceae bacterium]
MMHSRNYLFSTAIAIVTASLPVAAQETQRSGPAVSSGYEHVLLISVDGMHAVDLANWIQHNPNSNFAKLAATGIIYPNAFTTAPSDSYPGMIAQATGGSPKTAGLFYDDSYDRTVYPSKASFTSQGMTDPGCTGSPGAELTNFEELDKSYDFSTGLVADVTGGGTLGQVLTQLDPDNMQRRLVNGECTPIYPHQYIRTNTIFEVIKKAGGLTAWSDKHPAYEILSGPSGRGIDDLFAPEINSQLPGAPAGQDYTTSYSGVQKYDTLKVNAVVNWIDGLNSTATANPGVPTIFGMNFQAVSVGQKLAKAGFGDDPSLKGGYLDSNATPGNALQQQFEFVDNALGEFKAELVKRGLDNSTLIIVSAKHGQSPIDPKDRVIQSDKPFQQVPGFGSHGFEICDDVGLIWLEPDLQKDNYDAARAYLQANAATLHISELLDRTSLTPLYGDPFENSRVPDLIAVTDHGVICTGGTKLAEHGGFSDDDRNVLLLLSSAQIKAQVVEALSYTTQIAPTILAALGLDPRQLMSVQREGTSVLTR